jgi:Cu+-exporting ATPase
MQKIITKSIGYGLGAALALLAIYFLILSLVSGWGFAESQFFSFWYFIVSLAVGFGVQVGLYTYLKRFIKEKHGQGKVLGVTGTTSTAAMISCCAHYLVNLLPILGVTGFVSFVAQYQVKLFWLGLLFNIGGIVYIANKIVKFKQS